MASMALMCAMKMSSGSAVLETAATDDLDHRGGEIVCIYRELVGVPAVLGVASVGVDGAEHAVVDGYCEFMLEGVAGEGGMVDFDIDLEVLVEAVGAEETDDGLRIDVILVLCRLHGLGLDEECALEAMCAGVISGCSEHGGKVILLPLHLGVKDAVIAFAATPEHVRGATEFDGSVDRILDLDGCAGDYVEVGIGGGAVGVALVAEYIGRAPEVADAGLAHLLEKIVGDIFQAGLIFVNVIAVLYEVDVVEAEIADAEFLHDFESGIDLGAGAAIGAFAFVPLIGTGLAAEGISGCLAESMPPCHGEFEPVLHGFAHDDAFCVIIVECERILALSALETNLSD